MINQISHFYSKKFTKRMKITIYSSKFMNTNIKFDIRFHVNCIKVEIVKFLIQRKWKTENNVSYLFYVKL